MYIWVSSAAQRLRAWILQLFQEIVRVVSGMPDETTLCNRVLGFDIMRVQITTKELVF